MTTVPDIAGGDIGSGGSGVPPDMPQVYNGKLCDVDGCEERIPKKGEPGYAAARKKCDAHFVGQKSNPDRPSKRGPVDQRPVNVTIGGTSSPKSGGNAEDKRVAKVTKGATQMCQTFAVMVTMGGDKECGEAIALGAKAWGEAIGELSRYQPILAKIFAPTGEVTGQGLAWISAIAATAGIMIPVLAHHKLVSPALANKFAAGTMAVGAMTTTGDSGDPD